MVLQYNAGEWVAASFYKALWRFISSECFFVYIACGPPANHFAKDLMFPRLAKVVSRKVWCFRAWRKSLPEWFVISAHGESRFPKGLMFPRMAKVVSRMVWCFRHTFRIVSQMYITLRVSHLVENPIDGKAGFLYSLIACTNKMILLLNVNNSNISNKPFIISNVLNMQRRRCYSVFRPRSTRKIRMLR